MSTKIRLMRLGKIRTPFYRIVVIDSKKARNGLSIEEIGRYVPGQDPSIVEVNSDRAQHWLKVGAQPSAAALTFPYRRCNPRLDVEGEGEQGCVDAGVEACEGQGGGG